MCNGVKLRTWMDLCIYANGGMAGYGFQCYGVGKYICSLCEYPLVFGKPQSKRKIAICFMESFLIVQGLLC